MTSVEVVPGPESPDSAYGLRTLAAKIERGAGAREAGSHLRRESRPPLSDPQQEPNSDQTSSARSGRVWDTHAVCFCGKPFSEHPPGPPCPPPPPPGTPVA